MRGILIVFLLAAAARAQGEEVRELLTELADKDAYTRKIARRQILEMGGNAVPTLVETVSKEESPHRLEAVVVLGELGDTAMPAVPALTNALADGDGRIRLAAARALAGLGPRAHAAVEKLIDLARAQDWPQRFAARDALAAIGGAAVAPLLKAAAESRDDLRRWSAGVFHDLGAKTVPAALEALKSDDEKVRVAAVDALGATAAGSIAVLPLVKALHDPRAVVRRHAALALGGVGRGALDATPALIHLANDVTRRAVPEAITALGMIVRDAAHDARRPPPARPAVREAIGIGIDWLVRHQDDDGKWDCAGFDKHAPADRKNGGAGTEAYTIGVTGLACLAMLESGDPGRYREPLRRGLRYLVSIQTPEGCFGPMTARNFMYRHAAATLAMCVAARLLDDPVYRRSARRGTDFTLAARNPDKAWRYEPRGGDNDTSVTGWCILGLIEARLAGFVVPQSAFDGALAWVDEMTDPKTGRAGYNRRGGGSARPDSMRPRYPEGKTRAVTAEALYIRLAAGQRLDAPLCRANLEATLEILPAWDLEGGTLDMYYWFQGTRALHYVGGSHWSKWKKALAKAILPNQLPKDHGTGAGSWEPIGAWCGDGGRVYSTAILVNCLETLAGLTSPIEMKLPSTPRLRAAVATLKIARQSREPKIRRLAEDALTGFALR